MFKNSEHLQISHSLKSYFKITYEKASRVYTIKYEDKVTVHCPARYIFAFKGSPNICHL